jgi:hypothetical protein
VHWDIIDVYRKLDYDESKTVAEQLLCRFVRCNAAAPQKIAVRPGQDSIDGTGDAAGPHKTAVRPGQDSIDGTGDAAGPQKTAVRHGRDSIDGTGDAKKPQNFDAKERQ